MLAPLAAVLWVGIVPLAEAIRLDHSELEYTPVAFTFGCDD